MGHVTLGQTHTKYKQCWWRWENLAPGQARERSRRETIFTPIYHPQWAINHRQRFAAAGHHTHVIFVCVYHFQINSAPTHSRHPFAALAHSLCCYYFGSQGDALIQIMRFVLVLYTKLMKTRGMRLLVADRREFPTVLLLQPFIPY